MSGVDVVFLLVVGGRFVLPLFIPRYPLPAIIACLILDGVDQTIFQAFGYDPPGYQSYDKAMDVFYLAIAYLSTMRNWSSHPAYAVARFLFFYRLLGALLFELTGARAVLLIFPNTFEYFFIAYEALRSRWQPLRYDLRFWMVVAGLIWVVVKLPQEYWLHVAELDVTDTLRDHSWAPPLLIVLVVALLTVLWFVVRPRLPRPDWALRVAADPMPPAVASVHQQAALRLRGGWVWSWITAEKVVLVGLMSVIYAETIPGVSASSRQLFTFTAIFVVANAGITLAASRRDWTIESAGLAVVARVGVNLAMVLVAEALGAGRDLDLWPTLFFLSLISLITTLHDRYQPVLAYREHELERVRSRV